MMSNDRHDISDLILIDHRCVCNKLLFRGLLLSSTLEIKCKRCGQISIIGSATNHVENDTHYSMLFDESMHIMDTSPSATKILGYTREDLLASTPSQRNFLFKMDTDNRLWTMTTRLNFESFTFETAHIKKTGEVIPVRAHVRFSHDDSRVSALVMFECLKTRGQRLIDQGLQTDTIADLTCDLSAQVNSIGTYTYVSKGLATLLGYTPEAMLGQPMINFYPLAQRDSREESFFSTYSIKADFQDRTPGDYN